MAPLDDRHLTTAGLVRGDFLPLTLEEFRRGYGLLMAVLTGNANAAPDFPEAYQDAATGEARPFPDTPFNRAWYTAGKLFDDDAKRLSFYKRVEASAAFVNGKYSKYVGDHASTMHIALLATVAQVPLSSRTTKKALRAAFDAEFKRQLARTAMNYKSTQ